MEAGVMESPEREAFVAEPVVLGEGWLNWAPHERITDRYGSVFLQDELELPAEWGIVPASGTPGRLVATVLSARESKHIGDLFRGLRPSTPEPGEVILLGEGQFFIENLNQTHCVGVRPDPIPESDWMDPMALYRCHSQLVRLTFEPTGPSPIPKDPEPGPEGPSENGVSENGA